MRRVAPVLLAFLAAILAPVLIWVGLGIFHMSQIALNIPRKNAVALVQGIVLRFELGNDTKMITQLLAARRRGPDQLLAVFTFNLTTNMFFPMFQGKR